MKAVWALDGREEGGGGHLLSVHVVLLACHVLLSIALVKKENAKSWNQARLRETESLLTAIMIHTNNDMQRGNSLENCTVVKRS